MDHGSNGKILDTWKLSALPTEDLERFRDGEAGWKLLQQKRSLRTYGGQVGILEIRRSLRQCCSRRSWQKRLPISTWIRTYSWADLRGDLIAGITVGMTVIPQALAYSQIAELPLEYGLYSSFMGCFVYSILGTSKDLTLGTTAIVSLLTAEAFPKDAGAFKPQYAVLLAFYAGLIQFLMGFLNLGFLISFVSTPVISGFTTASAFIILYGQLKSVLGVSFGRSTDAVIQQTTGYIQNLRNINGWDVLIGCVCMGVLLTLKELRLRRSANTGPKSKYWEVLRSTCRIISVARYGIVVLVAGLMGFLLELYQHDAHSVTLTKHVHAGLPPFQMPVFAFNNKTFVEVFEDIGSGLVVVSLVGAMESIAIAKAFANQFQYHIDPTQEFVALGMANFVSSFVSSYPITGSFTKSALNAQSGVRTPMGCVFTGTFVLVAVALFSSYFRYVPKAALGAIIICAVSCMFEWKIFQDLWRLNKKELIPLTATIAASIFFGVDYGLLAGIGLSLVLLLYPLARPSIGVDSSEYILRKDDDPGACKKMTEIHITPQGALFFPSAEYVKEFFQNDIIPNPAPLPAQPDAANGSVNLENGRLVDMPDCSAADMEEIVVFNGIHLLNSDYTTLRGLRSVVLACRKAGKILRFVNTPAHILKVILPKEMRDEPKEADAANLTATVQFSRSLPERMASVVSDHLDNLDADPGGDLDAGFYVRNP